VLFSLKNYRENGCLYDKVYSQYGPFYFLFITGLTEALHVEITHDNARWIYMGIWLMTAFFSSQTVYILTRSNVWRIICFIGHLLYTHITMIDPLHPGGTIALLLSITAFIAARFNGNPRQRTFFAAMMGIISACILLTKINVGMFLIITVALWLVALGPDAGLFRLARYLSYPALFLLPYLLMFKMLNRLEYLILALMYSFSVLPVLLLANSRREKITGWREVRIYLSCLLITMAIIIMLICRTGTTLSSLWQGVVVKPLNQPDAYWFCIDWRWWSVAAAIGGLFVYGFYRINVNVPIISAAVIFWPISAVKILLGSS